MKKGAILLVLIILISSVSFAQELKPGRLWINNVEIPYEKSDFEDLFSDLEKSFEKKSISYVYANGQRIAKVENNEVYYFHNDHLGSPVAITNSSGNVIWQADYLPFGESFNEVSFDGNNIKYNSKELDKDTDLYYYGARYYNAPAGRFITADTVKGEIVDPQSLNLYVYTKNNPIKYVDEKGEQGVLGAAIGTVIGAGSEYARQRWIEKQEEIDWKKIALSGAAGGVAGATGGWIVGAVAKLTGSATTIGAGIGYGMLYGGMSGAGAGAAGQATINILEGKDPTEGVGKAALKGGAIGIVTGPIGSLFRGASKSVSEGVKSVTQKQSIPKLRIDVGKGEEIMEKIPRMKPQAGTIAGGPKPEETLKSGYEVSKNAMNQWYQKKGNLYEWNPQVQASQWNPRR